MAHLTLIILPIVLRNAFNCVLLTFINTQVFNSGTYYISKENKVFFFLNIYFFIVHSVGVVTISIDMVQLVTVT